MAAKHAFLSFVVEDLTLVNLFRGQARSQRNDLTFDDYSVKQPFDSTDGDYIRTQIRAKIRSASLLICLIGTQTASSRWVDWEIDFAGQERKRLLGVRLYNGTKGERTPSTLTRHGGVVKNWDLGDIIAWIG
jgi:hypothetical protein